MDEGTRETFESPLEDVLTDLPQEEPPADLRDRCVTALREAHQAHQPARQPYWPLLWKGAIGLAAACVLIVGVSTVVIQSKRASSSFDGEMMADAPAESAEMMKQAAAPRPDAGPALERQLDGAASDELLLIEAAPPATEAEEESGGDAAAAPAGRAMAARSPEAPKGAAGMARGAVDATADAEDAETPSPAETAKVDVYPTRRGDEWTGPDLVELVLAAEDVEEAQTAIRQLLEKRRGRVVDSEADANEGSAVTLLTARVPADRADEIISEMRKLGAREPQKPAALTDDLQAKSRAAKANDAAPPSTPAPPSEEPPGGPGRVPNYVTITVTISQATDDD